jgi:hypothetical protein
MSPYTKANILPVTMGYDMLTHFVIVIDFSPTIADRSWRRGCEMYDVHEWN